MCYYDDNLRYIFRDVTGDKIPEAFFYSERARCHGGTGLFTKDGYSRLLLCEPLTLDHRSFSITKERRPLL